MTEGPTIIKRKDLYYLFYTANDFRNPDYAVGYAVSSSPYGPWKKYTGNPILSRKNIGTNGTGHGDFDLNKRRNLVYVFHTHYSPTKATPRKTAIIKASFSKGKVNGEDQVSVDPTTFYFPQVE
ncbi:MAG: family 43 glycosylhydrolase [Chitinophagaceae bacterium]